MPMQAKDTMDDNGSIIFKWQCRHNEAPSLVSSPTNSFKKPIINKKRPHMSSQIRMSKRRKLPSKKIDSNIYVTSHCTGDRSTQQLFTTDISSAASDLLDNSTGNVQIMDNSLDGIDSTISGQVSGVPINQPQVTRLYTNAVPNIYSQDFNSIISSYEARICDLRTLKTCTNCFESWPGLTFHHSTSSICRKCEKDPVTYSALNDMIPCQLDASLIGLTEVEQLLISPIISIFQVRRLIFGQLSYANHVINFSQDIEDFVNVLPRITVPIIVLQKTNSSGVDKSLRVRRARVSGALNYLLNNNPYYAFIKLSAQNLSKLPVDGQMPDLNVQVTGKSSVVLAGTTSDDSDDSDCEDYECGVVSHNQNHSEAQRRQDAITRVLWPLQGNKPISEFCTRGFFAMSFPCLFGDGSATFNPNQGRLQGFRTAKLTLEHYCSHLMRFHDRRFMRDNRFRYVCCNMLMRWRILHSSGVCVKNRKQVSLDKLRTDPQERNDLIRDTVAYTSCQAGSDAYWGLRQHELATMVEQLGQPSFFMTFSTADIYWDDVKQLVGFVPMLNESPIDQSIRLRKLVSVNIGIVDSYVCKKFEIFLRHVLYKIFPTMTDHFFRAEVQARGLFHWHGLIYLSDAPDVASPDVDLCQVRAFVDKHLSSWNPRAVAPNVIPSIANVGVNPCSYRFNDILSYDDFIEKMVNACQRHKCSQRVCLRPNITGDNSLICRYHFPKTVCDETEVSFSKRGEVIVKNARNDSYTNSYNYGLMLAWRANHDMQFCSSPKQTTSYICKYTCKKEVRSSHMRKCHDLILDLPNDTPVVKSAQKVACSVVGERDISAAEAFHVIMSEKFHYVSRVFVYVNTEGIRSLIADGSTSLSVIDVYIRRDAVLTNMSLKQFFKRHDRKGKALQPAAKDNIVVRRPWLKVNLQCERYCKQQVLFNSCFRSVEEAKWPNLSWCETYSALFVEANPIVLDTPLINQASTSSSDISLPRQHLIGADGVLEVASDQSSWVHILSNNNSQLASNNSSQLSDGIHHDWMTSSSHYDRDELVRWMERVKLSHNNIISDPAPDLSLMNTEQKRLYDYVKQHLEDSVNPGNPPMRAILLGYAGTGKTFVIKAIRHLLGARCVTLAPTGTAACLIRGYTIHNGLSLPPTVYSELKGNALLSIQETFSSVSYIIIDEISMVGQKMLGMIHKRLMQARVNNDIMGGISFLFCGDFAQLPPVLDRPLYKPLPPGGNRSNLLRSLQMDGIRAYRSINKAFRLTEIVRQNNDSNFTDLLLRMRDGVSTEADWRLLMTRNIHSPHINTIEFDGVIRLFPLKSQVKAYNKTEMQRICPSRVVINANHSERGGSNASSIDASGLEKTITLGIGCRVMLTSNIWTEMRLVNGAMGTVVDIVYNDNCPPPALPICVLVKFDDYDGPMFNNTTPIAPIRRQIEKTSFFRTQVPLAVAFATTTHKSQGKGFAKAVVDIGAREMETGLTYTTFSRVEKLDGLLVETFDAERITTLHKSMGYRKTEEARLQQLQ